MMHGLVRGALPKALLSFAAISFAAPVSATDSGVTVFTHVSLVTMDDETVRGDRSVEVKGDSITAVRPDRRYKVPRGAHVIDGRGMFLMPGLADMHTHVPEYEQAPEFLAHYLAYGVTSIRLLSGNPNLLRLRDAIARGEMLAPRMWVSGPILTGSTGRSAEENPQQMVVDTAQEARRAVDAQIDAGYDLIKLYDGLSQEAFLAAAQEARRRGGYVIGHLPDQIPLDVALGSGLDEIAHVDELVSYHWIGYDPSKQYSADGIAKLKLDCASIGQTVNLIRQHGVAIVSNLITDQVVYEGIADDSALLSEPQYREVPNELLDRWRAQGRFVRWRGQATYRRDTIQPFLRQMARALAQAGVTITTGSDLGVEGMVPGFSAVRDIQLLEEAGLTPFQALSAGTRNAATVAGRMGKPANWGRIAKGYRADLVLLAANPLSTTRNLDLVRGVMVAGQWLPPERLASLKRAGLSGHGERLEPLKRR